MTDKITIKFGPSKSKSLPEVIYYAKCFWNCREHGGGYVITFDGKELIQNWWAFNIVFNRVRKWKSFHVWINDKEIFDYSDFFYSLQDMKNCYSGMPAYDPRRICQQSDWGCVWLKNIRINPAWPPSPFWFTFGHFDGLKWVIDKDRLRFTLEEEVKKRRLDFCPLFDRAYLHQQVDDLPDYIDMTENDEYVIVYESRFVGSKLTEVPSYIEHKKLNGGAYRYHNL